MFSNTDATFSGQERILLDNISIGDYLLINCSSTNGSTSGHESCGSVIIKVNSINGNQYARLIFTSWVGAGGSIICNRDMIIESSSKVRFSDCTQTSITSGSATNTTANYNCRPRSIYKFNPV